VALPPEHPWWGKDYGDCTASPQCEPEPPPDFEEMAKSGWPVPPPGSRFRDRMMETRWSCEHQPQMILDVHGGVTYGGPAFWPDAENDLDWGFGFDCAHAGDVSPMMDATIRNMLYQYEDEAWARRQAHFGDVYRDLAYVTRQVEQLAAQLALVRQVGGIGPSVAESQTD
jgi:hypothetical protein